MSGTIRVDVPLGDRSYPVLVGAGARHELAPVLRESKLTAGAQRAAVVTQPGIGVDVDPGIPFEIFEIPDGEQAKELASIGELCSGFARFGLTRRDVVVGVGGGVVTDVAGFAAAVYHRGVAVVHVATTLLGQIDAAVGGKTGVNLAEGKNLVGAFWQPAAVLCDTEVLDTLPERELRAGLGELAKYHFIGSPAAQRWLAKSGGNLAELPIDERVAACVAIKAEVVSFRRDRGRPPGAAELRAHAGPRTRDRGPLRPAPRRGGGDRTALCGGGSASAQTHRRRSGG